MATKKWSDVKLAKGARMTPTDEARDWREGMYRVVHGDGTGCWHRDRRKVERRALPRREPLDVEALARAWHAVYERDPQAVPITWDTADEATRRMWRNHARLAAAEYARLEAER